MGQKCLLRRIIYFRFMKIWSISNQSEAEKPPTKHLFPVSEFVPYLYKEKINISEANFSRIWTKKVWTILPIRFKTFHQHNWLVFISVHSGQSIEMFLFATTVLLLSLFWYKKRSQHKNKWLHTKSGEWCILFIV